MVVSITTILNLVLNNRHLSVAWRSYSHRAPFSCVYKNMLLKRILAASLVIGLILVVGSLGMAEAQSQFSLGLQGLAWGHSTISVLIVPQEGMSWWQPSYLNATLHAVDEWNNAIYYFAMNYSGFSYLSRLRLIPTVAESTASGYDVYITWVKVFQNPTSDEIGSSQAVYEPPGTMTNNTIILASENAHGRVLNEYDMQSIALHEVGHSLGLSHSSYSADIMYPSYTPKTTVQALSTLDLYAVSTIMAWMASSVYDPLRSPPQIPSVALPENITYQFLPVSYWDLPSLPPPSENSLDPILQLLASPESLFTILAVVIVVTLVDISLRRRRKYPQSNEEYSQYGPVPSNLSVAQILVQRAIMETRMVLRPGFEPGFPARLASHL